eukprot:5364672-Lingulodinium_polyedra.AAC.1
MPPRVLHEGGGHLRPWAQIEHPRARGPAAEAPSQHGGPRHGEVGEGVLREHVVVREGHED